MTMNWRMWTEHSRQNMKAAEHGAILEEIGGMYVEMQCAERGSTHRHELEKMLRITMEIYMELHSKDKPS